MKKKIKFTLVFDENNIAFKKGEKKTFTGIHESYFFHKSGRFSDESIEKISSYKNGKLHGIYKEFFNDAGSRLEFKKGNAKNSFYKKLLAKDPSRKFYEGEPNKLKLECFYNAGKLEGVFKRYNPGGKIIERSTYKNDKLNGISEIYNPGKTYFKKMSTYKNNKLNGISEVYMNIKGEEKLASSVSYKNDKQNGTFKRYYENGKLHIISKYKNGKKVGTYKVYYENGQLDQDENYKNGRIDGIRKIYYENGKLHIISKHKKDIRNGTYKVYYENGQLDKVENYKNGRIDGISKIYYENGQISRTCSYKKGECNGVVKDYHENGQLSRVGVQKNNLYDGNVKSYYENGQLEKISFWKKTQLGQSEVIVEKYNDDGSPDKILSKSNLNILSKKNTPSKDLPKYYFPKKPNNLKIYHPTEDYKKDISTAKFYGGTKYNYPSVVHCYNNNIYNNNSKSKKSVKYIFKKIETIAENFVWTFSMAGESVNSYYLETTKDHYLLWETYRSEDEGMGSLYGIKEGDDEYDSYPEFYELKCLCKKNILSKKDTVILLLFDHWKDSSKETFPDEFGDLGELLSMEEITIIFDHIKASK